MFTIGSSTIIRLKAERAEALAGAEDPEFQEGYRAGFFWADRANYVEISCVQSALSQIEHGSNDALHQLRTMGCDSIQDMNDADLQKLLGGTLTNQAAYGFLQGVGMFIKQAEAKGVRFSPLDFA